MRRQLFKSHDYGVNTCLRCLEKQREIDRLKAENQRLKVVLRYRQRKQGDGPFGSSTPSSQIVLKATSKPEDQAKPGGARLGQACHNKSDLHFMQPICAKIHYSVIQCANFTAIINHHSGGG
jgi:hypothetical protein